jgi:hypothetical protein
MNIALRPSGGRGEYELAGTHGATAVNDLYSLRIFLETVPGVAIDTVSVCEQRDGKPRIRLAQPAKNAHPSSLIAASMLLPKPRRAKAKAQAATLIQWNGFVVQTVRVDVVQVSTTSVVLRPVTIKLENASGDRADIDYSERMSRVVRVWTAAATGSSSIDQAVRDHAVAFGSSTSTHPQILSALTGVHRALGNPTGDLLRVLESHYHLAGVPASFGAMSAEITDADYDESVLTSPLEARVTRVRQWRKAAVRGPAASQFRKDVRLAYDHRCLISGLRLPKTDNNPRAGVDAAHILPWSRYDLDRPENGICLSKQCHWAFDEGILRLKYDESIKNYVVFIPNDFKAAAHRAAFDVATFSAFEGPVPKARLPRDCKYWPAKTYLDELNQFLDGDSP